MKMKRISLARNIMLILLITAVLVCPLSACDSSSASGDAVKLSFKDASGYDYLKTLNGKQVTISGYMATSSPVDGSFIFLMNLPYQSCPFCLPNTSQLSNTMEVYPGKGTTFEQTTQAIRVVGTLVVAEDPDKPFVDEFGYEFNYKVVDATYTVIRAEELSSDMALWQKVAEADIVNDIYKMYDYVNFLCAWNTYFVNSYTDESGATVAGYYLYASDAEKYIYPDGGQFHYGYRDGYFDSIVAAIEAIDKTAFADLVANVRKAETLAADALSELENGNYTFEKQYVEKFGQEDYIYTLTNGEALTQRMQALYAEFSNWLGNWEM